MREISAEEVVPGDIVWLESGNRVPADIRLISTQSLEVDESLLTGESHAVSKNADWIGEKATTLADQLNMAFAGSMIARGRAKGVVIATGMATSVGQLALDVMGSGGGKPPLLVRMERFTNYVAIGTLVASVVIGLLGIVIWKYTLVDTFFFVIALAVAAIPEGLPVAMTVALAVATTRMAKRNVIVRRLTAVEGLGSCTLIATDKTGTLTCNELTIRELKLANGGVYQITGEGFVPDGQVLFNGSVVETSVGRESPLAKIIQAAVLCNEGDLHHRNGDWKWRGDAVDVALLSLGIKAGIRREQLFEQFPQIAGIPFESEYQYAASFHRSGQDTVVFVKGAPERVLDMCSAQFSVAERIQHEASALEMAKRGLRVIAVATGRVQQKLSPGEAPPTPAELQLLGFLGMIDPLRAGAREAVANCQLAGVQVTMITGDHRITAFAIARELGLADQEDQVITAAEIVGKSAAEMADIVSRSAYLPESLPVKNWKSSMRRGGLVILLRSPVTESTMHRRCVRQTSESPWEKREPTWRAKRRNWFSVMTISVPLSVELKKAAWLMTTSAK